MGEPDQLACVVLRHADIGSQTLMPLELSIANSIKNVDQRQQFTLGRLAAHQALQQIGVQELWPITRGVDGEPVFPTSCVGSISHTSGVGAAVVGRAESFLSVGLDIEATNRTLAKDILKRIAIPAERLWAEEKASEKRLRTLKIFSAKESIFKALYPLTRKRMDFKDVFVRWEDEHDAFIATLLSDLSEDFPAGALLPTYCVEEQDVILTSTLISPSEESPEETA